MAPAAAPSGATAWLFPGQGAQHVGMGRDLYDAFPEARAVYERADAALDRPLSSIIFDGPEEDLLQTINAQPAILITSLACLAAAQAAGIVGHPSAVAGVASDRAPAYVAGHSLGEYSALVAAGSIGFGEAVRLVHLRGQYMQAAVPQGVGAMAALLGIDARTAARVCEEAAEAQIVSSANLNSPSQIVIAGHAEAVTRAVEIAKRAGARKAVLLEVSAPFHCALMDPAREALTPDLDAAAFADLKVPLVNNWQAAEVRLGEAAREGLKQQIPNPVLWDPVIRHLASRKIDRFVEVGPGRVLTGLMRGIDRSLAASSTHNLNSLESISA